MSNIYQFFNKAISGTPNLKIRSHWKLQGQCCFYWNGIQNTKSFEISCVSCKQKNTFDSLQNQWYHWCTAIQYLSLYPLSLCPTQSLLATVSLPNNASIKGPRKHNRQAGTYYYIPLFLSVPPDMQVSTRTALMHIGRDTSYVIGNREQEFCLSCLDSGRLLFASFQVLSEKNTRLRHSCSTACFCKFMLWYLKWCISHRKHNFWRA